MADMTRKQRSGAGNRAHYAARDAAEAAAREDAARERRESAYGDIKPPPDNPIGVLAWTHQALARMLFDVLRDPSIGEQERRRFASDIAAKIGMTGPKAVSDARLVALEKQLGVAKDTDSDAADLDTRPTRSNRAGSARGDTLPPAAPVADEEGGR